MYESHAKILIRTGNDLSISDNDTREMAIKNAIGLKSFYSSSINNEIMILTSKSTIQQAVEKLGWEVSYSTKQQPVDVANNSINYRSKMNTNGLRFLQERQINLFFILII